MEKKTTKKVATKTASKQKASKTIKHDDYVLAPESTPFVTNYDAKPSLLQRIKKFLGL
jgi:hypothetical protein